MWLDKIIYALAPRAALKRKQARIAIELLNRSYDGAKTGRRIDDWIARGTSANSEIANAGHRLRERARDLVRNNPYGSKAIDVFVSNAVGTGITAQAATTHERLNKQIMSAWHLWTENCDADSDLNFEGIQALVARAMFESGECFLRFKSCKEKHVPLELQVLEADFLDTAKTNNNIKQGIEFNDQGQKIAYWLWPEHPGENSGRTLKSLRVPATEILHIFRKTRPGQYRGVTAFAPCMIRMRDLDDYDDAELWRKKIEACFAAFVIQNSGIDVPVAGPAKYRNQHKVEEFRPGMIEYLQPGEDIRFSSPDSDNNYEAYERVQLHAIAAGLGLTYEQLTGDLSQVNYSSLRAGLLEFRRHVEMIRWQVLIPKLCTPIWRKFIDRAFIAGVISKVDYLVSWTPPKFEMIDPLKDAQADTMMLRNGTMTQKEAIAQRGYDPEQQLAEIAATNKKLDELGIILDSDPRTTAKSGMMQIDKNYDS